jgi:hypothetical protein
MMIWTSTTSIIGNYALATKVVEMLAPQKDRSNTVDTTLL